MNDLRIEVSTEQAGTRLDLVLAGALGSRSEAVRRIDAGLVTVDGRERQKRHKVTLGALIEVGEAPVAPVADVAPAKFRIAYEDEHLFVIDKPAGVVIHPAPGHRSGTLAQALAGRVAGGEDPERPGIVHRLDRDTSGLLVVARSDRVHDALSDAIRARLIVREYLALVQGRPASRTGTIDAPIGRDRRRRERISTETDQPREARTHFEIEQELPGATLLRVTLETGRTHQIRVHLAAIDLPVAGDREYGKPDVYGLTRQFLHAARLAFDHPVTGEAIAVESQLPSDLVASLDAARR